MTKKEAVKKLKGFDLIGSNEDIEFQYALDMAIQALKEKSTDEVVQKIRTAIGINLYEIASKFDESYGDAAIYLQELIDKAVGE